MCFFKDVRKQGEMDCWRDGCLTSTSSIISPAVFLYLSIPYAAAAGNTSVSVSYMEREKKISFHFTTRTQNEVWRVTLGGTVSFHRSWWPGDLCLYEGIYSSGLQGFSLFFHGAWVACEPHWSSPSLTPSYLTVERFFSLSLSEIRTHLL